jgi:hypothetical protein
MRLRTPERWTRSPQSDSRTIIRRGARCVLKRRFQVGMETIERAIATIAPQRLRVENQLGFKIVDWMRNIEFVASARTIGKGYGGKNENDEYYRAVANI